MATSIAQGDAVAVVLAGGGARGAYEMGALSELLPALGEAERPRIFVGTSVGAINAAYLAANADHSPQQIADAGRRLWESISYPDVLEPLISRSEVGRLGAYLGQVLRAGTSADSLLDPAPLAHTLRKLVPFEKIARNVEDRRIDAAAVVATSGLTNESVVFHEGGHPSPTLDRRRGIRYVPTRVSEHHVRASAAIPVFFPAVPVDAGGKRRWYFDGGTRLNTPIKPALALGADRVIVIALNSLASSKDPKAETRPDALDGATQLIQAVLVDPLVNDVHTLATVNELLADTSEERTRAHERRTGRRRVPYMLIAPQ